MAENFNSILVREKEHEQGKQVQKRNT